MVFASSIDRWIKRSPSLLLDFSQKSLEEVASFFHDHIPLYLGFIGFLSCSLAQKFSFLALGWLLLTLIAFITRAGEKLLWGIFSATLIGLLILRALYALPSGDPLLTPTQGMGIFIPEKIATRAHFFRTKPYVIGKLITFQTEKGGIWRHLPVSFPFDEKFISKTLLIEAELKPTLSSQYSLKIKQIKPLEPSVNFSLMRWKWQQKLLGYIQRVTPSEEVKNFLMALLSGQIQEATLSLEFFKVGLSHILAISGFHFGVIAAVCSFLIFSFFPKKIAPWILSICLILYGFFVGLSPSVLRSLLMSLLTLYGAVLYKKSFSLNTLGIALLLTTLCFPTLCLSVGFLLTFLCTFSILFFYPVMDRSLQKIFPKRSKIFWLQAPTLEKTLLLLSTFLRKALALNLAVFLWTTPYLFHVFGHFPLLSLAYNLFIPLWVTAAIFLFMMASGIHAIFPSLALFIHRLNTASTEKMLTIIAHPPPSLDLQWHLALSQNIVILWLTIFFLIGLSQIAK